MAIEKTLEILNEMKADPKAQELFKGMEKPKSPDEAITLSDVLPEGLRGSEEAALRQALQHL